MKKSIRLALFVAGLTATTAWVLYYFDEYLGPGGEVLNLDSYMHARSMDNSRSKWLAARFGEFHVISGHGALRKGRYYLEDSREGHEGNLHLPSSIARQVVASNVPIDQPVLLLMCQGAKGKESFAQRLSELIPHRIIASPNYMLVGYKGSLTTSLDKSFAAAANGGREINLVEFRRGVLTDKYRKVL